MKRLKRIFLVGLFAQFFLLTASAQFNWQSWNKMPDLVIQRDGTITNAKIMVVGKDKTTYAVGRGKNATQMELANSELFMLRFEERGSIVFDARGERILTTSTTEQFPKGAVLLFLCSGQIMPVYHLSIDQHAARYFLDKKGEGRKGFLPKSDIFMVCYPDGTRDIITTLTPPQPPVTTDDDNDEDDIDVDPVTPEDEKETPAPQTLPRVTLVLTNGAQLNVWLVKEERTRVSYKKENSAKASIFVMQKSRIRSIVR